MPSKKRQAEITAFHARLKTNMDTKEQTSVSQNFPPVSSPAATASAPRSANPRDKQAVHFSSQSDEWETPAAFFAQLDAEFHFTLDAAATYENTKTAVFLNKENDGLKQNWYKLSTHNGAGVVWCNPPYSRGLQAAFIKKASEEAAKGATVVLLIPARTDTKAFHEIIMKTASEIRFVEGRLKFSEATQSAPFPSMVVVFRPPQTASEPQREHQHGVLPIATQYTSVPVLSVIPRKPGFVPPAREQEPQIPAPTPPPHAL